MKNLILIFAISAFSLSILSFTVNENKPIIHTQGEVPTFSIPTDVQDIIDNSCYGCHNSESSSTKGKMKLSFDKLTDAKISKQVGKLMKISKVVKKGNMPPEKFITKYPDKALTKEDSDKLIDWADDLANKLSGE